MKQEVKIFEGPVRASIERDINAQLNSGKRLISASLSTVGEGEFIHRWMALVVFESKEESV